MTRHEAERYEQESVMRAGGIVIATALLPECSALTLLTTVLRNAPLAPSDNQGKIRNEPEAPVA
ncbi:hypothetical protein [Atlantibacter subterraneus]|uniref:hypothetical protein n=1 Tax=Atlantibacter subterraneus TaxID=255519 RepID=UPI0029643F05|nr:hypothetical protein [Atlantibacter subterranea]MDW2743661.1 hypothetical protein [Atlantibacter subterranea]